MSHCKFNYGDMVNQLLQIYDYNEKWYKRRTVWRNNRKKLAPVVCWSMHVWAIQCDNKDTTNSVILVDVLTAVARGSEPAVTESRQGHRRQRVEVRKAVTRRRRWWRPPQMFYSSVRPSVCPASVIITLSVGGRCRAAPKAMWSTPTVSRHIPEAPSGNPSRLDERPRTRPSRRQGRQIANLYWAGANNDDETVRIWADYHTQMYTRRPLRLDSDILRRAININDQSSVL